MTWWIACVENVLTPILPLISVGRSTPSFVYVDRVSGLNGSPVYAATLLFVILVLFKGVNNERTFVTTFQRSRLSRL